MNNDFNDETPYYRSPPPETPYLRAKQVWDERLSNFALGADLWRKIALMSMLLVVLLLLLLLLSLSWHKPKLYIAEVASSGQVLNVKMLAQEYQPTVAEEEYFIVQFIKLVQGVPLDPVAARNNWRAAYNFLSQRGAELLTQYFNKNSPLAVLGKKTVTIQINNINPISKNSYEVDWVEQSVGQNGQLISQRSMSGVFTLMVQTPKTQGAILQNPLGIYIVDFHMSPKLEATN